MLTNCQTRVKLGNKKFYTINLRNFVVPTRSVC